MMKRGVLKRVVSVLLACTMMVGLLPVCALTAYAAHRCPDCEGWIDGSPYCSECFVCDQCVEMCYECGKCVDCSGAEICDGCTNAEGDNFCTNCAEEKGAHCPNCDTCYYIAQGWCAECGACEECANICDECSVNLGFGMICEECAIDKDGHCPGCGDCYFNEGLWCSECMLCVDCSEHDAECSAIAGELLCKECAANLGNHCPDCSECYFEVGSWCEECGKCADCSPACLSCCEELGEIICEECAIEAGLHCSECSECYNGGEYCVECGVCGACAIICATDELCIECAITGGLHCPSCEECGDQAILCERCGERCIECADAFCEACNLCSECVLICRGCGSCEECAEICPNCEEYCSECEGLCDDCEFCLVCCEDIADFAGCDCADWVCVESGNRQEHFDEYHTNASGDHSARPSAAWTFDENQHWHNCVYCDDAAHRTNMAAHTYDATGKCTTCYFVKDAKIHIIVQPKDAKYVRVTSAEKDYDESNIAHFSVKAIGNSKLTYTWCRKQYVGGILKYVPLTNPNTYECYDGPNAAILAPTDACCTIYTYACIIADEAGNEVITNDVLIVGRHDYQYYKEWRTHERPYEYAERSKYGHILQCVGETCEKITHLLPHEDEDSDGYCDVCDFEIGKILVTKQPKDVSNVYVRSAMEEYDESNIAHFSVTAEGESELTYNWCRKMYVGGEPTYVPLTAPEQGECYDGADLYLLVPTDACCMTYTYACIITDEEGNETRTVDVLLKARHNYQYYTDYLTERENPYYDASRRYNGHIPVCVGEGCEKVSRLRQHEDADHDYICDLCDFEKDILNIGASVTAPVEGEFPNYEIVSDSPAYFALGSTAYSGTRRVWMVSENGETDWTAVDPTCPFVEGKYYKFYFEMHTADGYEFPPMASYGGESYFWAIVNGSYAKAYEVSGMDPLHHVFIEYNFGACGDSGANAPKIIENIVLEDITAPIAGEYPQYDCTVSGIGYTRNTAYDNGTYAINGICWYDLTYDMWMRPDRAFQVGHQYKAFVDVKTEEGYWFYTTGQNYKAAGFGYINGNSAVLGIQSEARFEQSLSVVFTCQPQAVKSVAVSGLEKPEGGCIPDFTAVTDSEFYKVESIEWFDYENNLDEMTDSDTFVEGNEYWVLITIVPNQDEGINMCKFAEDKTTATLNGIEVKKVKNNSWQEVVSSPKRVSIYYTFKSSFAVSGLVTSFNDVSGEITLQLIPEGLTEPAYETVVEGNTVDYSFASVSEGTYTLKVSKNNHVTREYTVVVGTEDIVRDVRLWLVGDVTRDGTVDPNDPAAVFYHINGLLGLEEDSLSVADVDRDGDIGLYDAARLFYYINGLLTEL